jgi:nicotinamidase-related amidase
MSQGSEYSGDELRYDFRLDPARTALLVVDMQYTNASRNTGRGKYLAEEGKGQRLSWRFDRIEQVVVPTVQRLLAYFREHGLRVMYVATGSQVDDFMDMPAYQRPFQRAAGNRVGSPYNAILREIAPLPGERVFPKTTQSAFMSTPIHTILRAMGIEYLVIVGVSTNGCVDATARNATDLNFHAVLVEDGTAAEREDFHNYALANFSTRKGRVLTGDAVIAELEAGLRAAGALGLAAEARDLAAAHR